MTNERRVTLSIKVKPSTLEAIKADAEKDDRTPSYIGAQILEGHYSDACESTKAMASKSKNIELYTMSFEKFWNAGMRKVNKKYAQKAFITIFKRHQFDDSFVRMVVNDIQERLNINQLGFAGMHPTTYLNGERWNDEIKGPSNEGRQSNNKQTGFQRSQAAYYETFPEEANLSAVGDADTSL